MCLAALLPRAGSFRRSMIALAVATCAMTAAARTRAADTTGDEAPAKLPGLLAIYDPPLVSRYEIKPAFALARGETPDPRLAAKNWKVLWKGVIEVHHPGKYRFSALHSGPVTVHVNGRLALDERASTASGPGPEIDLPFGLSKLAIVFVSTDAPPLFRLDWQSEKMARQAIPATSFGHLKGTLPAADVAYFGPNSKFAAGRLAVQEHNCIACHWPSGSIAATFCAAAPRGPRLIVSGKRLKAGWIYRWLGNPQALEPQAVMPRLFADNRAGEVERYAVAAYLGEHVTLRERQHQPAEKLDAKVAAGKQLYDRIGCAVCHEAHGNQPARATLRGLSQKTTPPELAKYLLDPLAVAPGGRMPKTALSTIEALSLAEYLVDRDRKQTVPLELPKPPSVAELRDLMLADSELPAQKTLALSDADVLKRVAGLGRRVIEQKNCAACHDFFNGRSYSPNSRLSLEIGHAKLSLGQIAAAPRGGCLAAAGAKPNGKTPVFGGSLDRAAVADFLKAALTAPGSRAPGEDARLTLERFNCLGCHERDGQGGLTPDMLKRLAANQTAETAELLSPPSLTGVTAKLLPSYLRGVLLDGKRSRPWMALRMPQFPPAAIAGLPAGLAALDAEPQTAVANHLPTANESDKESRRLDAAGRTLVGSRGFGCIKCHDMLGIQSGGTRGPDLARVAERVNFAWFDRWMTDPQQIQPGTRMPTVFLNGVSPYPDILGGDPAKQRLAIWHYLSHSARLPPPEGLEPQKTSKLPGASGAYQCVRTFLPEVTPRSMAIRYPNGVHLAYDLQECRLAYAWSGDFLDMSPVWNDRGGNPAKIKGAVFWHAPQGFPWDVSSSAGVVPDFTKRGSDTALAPRCRSTPSCIRRGSIFAAIISTRAARHSATNCNSTAATKPASPSKSSRSPAARSRACCGRRRLPPRAAKRYGSMRPPRIALPNGAPRMAKSACSTVRRNRPLATRRCAAFKAASRSYCTCAACRPAAFGSRPSKTASGASRCGSRPPAKTTQSICVWQCSARIIPPPALPPPWCPTS